MKKVWIWWVIAAMALATACGKDETGKKDDGGGSKEPTPVENPNIEGYVYADGNPVAGVVVSDGINCVQTGKDGKFALKADLGKARFVFVSQPAGYEAEVADGKAQFYKQLGTGSVQPIDGKYQNLRFTLKKITGNADRYTVVIAGDPQPRKRSYGYDNFAYHSLDCCDDMWRDMGEYTANIADRPVRGIMLGDLVHEDMSLYADYLKGIASLGYPTYSIIGNHDNNPKGKTDDEGALDFEKNLGPRNYSFNLGKFHVVVLDNLIMKLNSSGQLKDYEQGLTDDIWTWLQNDLKYVDFSTPLIVCAHSPMFRTDDGGERWSGGTAKLHHGPDYKNLLSKYKKVYAWAGHTHKTFNYVYDAKTSPDLANVECHTVGRVTGMLWLNEWVDDSGAPRGYVVAEIDGEDISWKFKPIAYQSGAASSKKVPEYKYRDITLRDGVFYRNGKKLDETYQLRAYPRGVNGDSYVYANVFMWDEKWGKVMFTPTKGTKVEMSRVNDKKIFDFAAKEVFDYYKTNNTTLAGNKDFSLGITTHLFRCHSTATTGGGTITVTDRFGNEYSTTVSW